MIKKIIHFFVLPCSKATLLLERRNAGMLSPIQQLRLGMHLKICAYCTAYSAKLAILDRILRKKEAHKKEFDIDLEGLKLRLKESLKK